MMWEWRRSCGGRRVGETGLNGGSMRETIQPVPLATCPLRWLLALPCHLPLARVPAPAPTWLGLAWLGAAIAASAWPGWVGAQADAADCPRARATREGKQQGDRKWRGRY